MSVSTGMTTVASLIAEKVRTANAVLSEDETRRLRAGLTAAGIVDQVKDEDLKLAQSIIDRALERFTATTATCGNCPRCAGMMRPVKVATQRNCRYCTSCRVVTPA